MIKIFSVADVRILDKYTIENEPISSVDLVERAATAFTTEFTRRFSKNAHIVVFAGPGNNGADALAIARMLSETGYTVEVYLFCPAQNISEACEMNRLRLLEMPHVNFHEIDAEFNPPDLKAQDIVIDGLFGSGINKPLSGGFASVVDYINESESTVVSIDIPSGLFGEDNKANNPEAIIRANLTLTFAFPKLAFFFPENAAYTGEWKVLDILMHPDIVARTKTPFYLVCESDIEDVIQPRNRFAHKGNFGHALLIAGSKGMMGSAVLASKACLRSGAGLLTTHIPQCGEPVLQTAFPEAMAEADAHTDYFTEIKTADRYQAVGVGPGIGQQLETALALGALFESVEKPMVIDADALNLIAANPELLQKVPKRSIFTPHPKEFDRLAGESETMYDRLMKARTYATDHQLIVVLKNAYTFMCMPGGNVYINNCGNPGMATAGSGDVLTGVLTGLLAQGLDPGAAAVTGVFLHATAGDWAANEKSEESMLAGDIVEMLGKAYKEFRQ